MTHVLVNDPTRGMAYSLKICWTQRDKKMAGVKAPVILLFFMIYCENKEIKYIDYDF